MSYSKKEGVGIQDGPRTVLMLLTNAYYPDPRVRQEALALIRMGLRVRLLAWDRDLKTLARECMEGVEVERVFLASAHGRGTTQLFYYAALYLKMLWRGWRASFDAIHCHDLDTLPIGFVLGKLKRKPIVYDAHESFPDMLHGNVHPIVKGGLVRLENFLMRRIDLLITVGEKLQGSFVKRGARRSAVVGNWKRLEDYKRTGQEIREIRHRHGIPDEALAVVCITQLLKDRKIEELLQAADGCPDVYVIVAGKGVLENLVRDWAARSPRIIYLGFLSSTEIASYTCAADVVYYGFDSDNPNARYSAPNKLFEALAAGRPLITGNFGEIADVVRRASCGIVLNDYGVVEIREALNVLRDPAIRCAMAENAKRYGREAANWSKGEETLNEEYGYLLSGSTLRERAASDLADTSRKVQVG